MRFDAKTEKTLDIKRDEAKNQINCRAFEIINAKFPIFKQQNANQRLVELVASNQINTVEWNQIQDQWKWVQEVRAASNSYHALLDNASTVEECINLLHEFLQKSF
ncbi:MAG: hypothetical protein QXN55_01685 [Candidatus Nitrosotenuis sp.]